MTDAAYLAERARLQHALLRFQAAGDKQQEEQQEPEAGVDGSDGVRYVRIKPCADPAEEDTLRALLETEARATPVRWCPPQESHRLFQLPASFRLAQFAPYQSGRVYGMDAASAAAVWALGPQPGEHILDLCCAPGLKLCAIADALASGGGSVTGVDVSKARLAVARKVAVKYAVGRPCQQPHQQQQQVTAGRRTMTCRLLCADGTDFDLGPLEECAAGGEEAVVFDSRAYDWQGMEARGQQRMNRGTRKKELLALKALLLSPSPSLMHQGEKLWSSESQAAKPMEDEGRVLYDRVLVDADCTHDGSTRHLSKVAALDTRIQTRAGGFLSREKLAGLEALQRGLICNGFRLLKPGGVLVYSTCSLSPQQNEAVVSHLLATHADAARLDPILDLGQPAYGYDDEDDGGRDEEGAEEEEEEEEASGERRRRKLLPCRWGKLPGTLVFEPRFGTSGLFVARVRKLLGEGKDSE